MPESIHLIYLDAYHLGDLLYVASMARMMGRLQRLPPCLFVHGSGEQAERLLEAEGLFPEQRDGLVVARTPQEAALVERALRQVNRRLVGTLTDEGVHAVGLHGTDRGLLRLRPDGVPTAGKTGWFQDLLRLRAVPVVSTLLRPRHAGTTREGSPSATTLALARALENVVVVFFTRNDQPGVLDGEAPRKYLSLDALEEAMLPEPEAVRRVAAAGLPVLLTSAVGLFGSKIPLGTKIFAPKTA